MSVSSIKQLTPLNQEVFRKTEEEKLALKEAKKKHKKKTKRS